MTTTDTITVPDLRALDALVHEVLEGDEIMCREPRPIVDCWVVRCTTCGHIFGDYDALRSDIGAPLGPKLKQDAHRVPPPHYTTDPRDWMAVVQKMEQRDDLWLIRLTSRCNKRHVWIAEVSGATLWVGAEHEQPGVAISLAAVEAKTGKRVVLG